MSNSTHSTNKIIFFSGKINLSVKFNAASQTMWKCSDMRWVISRSHITHENSFLMRSHFDVKPSSQHSAVALCIFPPRKNHINHMPLNLMHDMKRMRWFFYGASFHLRNSDSENRRHILYGDIFTIVFVKLFKDCLEAQDLLISTDKIIMLLGNRQTYYLNRSVILELCAIKWACTTFTCQPLPHA